MKFHPTDENILLSGGWDNTIQIWDKRSGSAVRSFYGPHLCGDSLDVCVDGGRSTILTGSWRPQAPLELWDMESGKVVEEVAWKDSLLGGQPCLLYAAQFSKGPGARYIGETKALTS